MTKKEFLTAVSAFEKDEPNCKIPALLALVDLLYWRYGFEPTPIRDTSFGVLEKAEGENAVKLARWLVLELWLGFDDYDNAEGVPAWLPRPPRPREESNRAAPKK